MASKQSQARSNISKMRKIARQVSKLNGQIHSKNGSGRSSTLRSGKSE
jgi:hypothetical protein